jgi:ABC-2 type transport system permease protein
VPVRSARILLVQTRYALVTGLRNPRVVVFGMVFPIVLLVLFNSIFASGSNSTTLFHGRHIDAAAYFTAGLAAYSIALQTFTQLAISVTTQRESGQLKRLRGTPMPPWTFVASLVLRSVLLVFAMVAVLLVVGALAFGVSIRGPSLVGVAVYALLGTGAMATLGIAVTALTPTADAASSVGPFAIVILSFISGVFIPVEALPGWLESIGRIFPLAHLADGLQRAIAIGPGTGLTATNVAVLAAWGLAGLVLSARTFRWEPQAAAG